MYVLSSSPGNTAHHPPARHLEIAYRLPINMKVTIKEWNAVASWRWDMPEDEVCGICRVQFDGTCPTCKFPGDDCSLCMFSSQQLIKSSLSNCISVIGTCGHSFHMVCSVTAPFRQPKLILSSTVFLRGLRKNLQKDFVPCADRVSRGQLNGHVQH